MGYLAKKFKVKVYGNGWQLPNAKPVRGYQMLQASRYGRIHINFAQTRAGYTNVKCGVFESIASGSCFMYKQQFEEIGKNILNTEQKLLASIVKKKNSVSR